MRLHPATALNDYEEERVSGFGDRQERRARREERRERKQQHRLDRRERRHERKATRQQERVPKKQRRSAARPGPPTLQPAPTALPPQRKASKLLGKAVDWVTDLVDDEEDEDAFAPDEDEGEADADDATEGIGAWSPFRRSLVVEVWGPAVQMGRRLRIQAAVGHRAAVIELKPGLYLVAEMPEALTRTEFGLAPLLAPMMMKAARRSMDEPGQERRGPFARMFRRRQREEPVRYVAVVQPSAPVPAPLALPGPTEDGTVMVPAPNVGWADDATVAAVYGCDACAHRGGR